MLLDRDPCPRLRPFVSRVWVSDGARPDSAAASARERVLPTGATHVVVRLEPRPLRVFAGPDDPVGREVGCALVGGARAEPYVRDVSQPAGTVGAMLRPGAAGLVLGVPAHALAHRHTPLEDVWGRDVARLRERLVLAPGPRARLALFEAFLATRLPAVRGVPPAIAHALARLAEGAAVGAVVDDLGMGRRRFVARFREAVGMTPRRWSRVRRFQRVLDHVAARPQDSWAEIAWAAGYADQPHLHREFRALAGVSPGAFRILSPGASHHVPIP